jgi:hypothetical protein
MSNDWSGRSPIRPTAPADGTRTTTSVRQTSRWANFNETFNETRARFIGTTVSRLTDLVRRHLPDLRRTKSAEMFVSSSSYSIWSVTAVLSVVSHLIWPAMAILSAVSHSNWSLHSLPP